MRIIPATPPTYTPAGRVLTWLITFLLSATTFTPLIISAGTLFPFQTGKGIAFRILVELAGFLYLCLSIIEPQARPKSDRLSWSVLAFGAALVITMLTGVDPLQSFWGDLERMEGVFGILHAIVLFVVVRGIFLQREDWVLFFRIATLSSLFVAMYAFAQVDPSFRFFSVVEARDLQPGSTFGHQSFLATYAIFQSFFGMFLVLLEKETRWKIYGVFAMGMNLIVLFLTAVRGAQVAVLAAVGLGIFLSILYVFKSTRLRLGLAGSLTACIITIAIIISLRDSPVLQRMPYAVQRLASISPEAPMAKTRLISFGVSWKAFQDRPIFGWGQENFVNGYNKYFDPEHLSYEQGWFDRAHNKLADIGVHSGIAGLLAYGSIFLFAFLGLTRVVRTRTDTSERMLAVGVLMLGTAYGIQNLFLFDMTVSYLFFFATLGFAGWIMREAEGDAVPVRGREKVGMNSSQRIAIAGAGVLTIVAMVWGNWIPYTTAALGRQSLDARDPGSALIAYNRAIESGGFPSAEVTRALLDELLNSGRVKQKEWGGVIERTRENAEVLAVKEYASVPLLIRLGKLYNELSLSRSDPQFLASAERVLQKAIQLSPTRPDGYYELGVTHLRRGESEKGLELFSSALALNVHNIRARWTLGLALISVGRFNEGLVEVENAVAWGYNWDTPADLRNLTTVFVSMNRHDRLVWLYEQVVVRHPGIADYHATLAHAYAATGSQAKAKEQMIKAAQFDERYRNQASQLTRAGDFSFNKRNNNAIQSQSRLK